MEDLANWKPQSNTVYKGYSRHSRRGHFFGKVIIHIRGNQYVGGVVGAWIMYIITELLGLRKPKTNSQK